MDEFAETRVGLDYSLVVYEFFNEMRNIIDIDKEAKIFQIFNKLDTLIGNLLTNVKLMKIRYHNLNRIKTSRIFSN